jgi:hypothetical protein
MSNGLPKQCPSCGGFGCTKPCSYSLTAEREALRKQRDELREACDNAANTIEALDEFNGSELQINKLRRLATGGE